MDELRKTGQFEKHYCKCGNITTKKGRQCNTCFNEEVAGSDGYSHRNGRNDENAEAMDTYNQRLTSGFNMLNLNQ